ncbi:MAG: hypothetical protein SH809_13510 [Rhodothermales bacterium]|nr:hypothetical protein [Rhodothermales bacterium]
MIRLAIPSLLGCTLAAFALAGCEPAPVRPQFGAPYELIPSGSAGGPDTPPRIRGDRLLASLSYTGGCADHDFVLDYAARRDTVHLWIVHEDGGDSCDAYLMDDLTLELPLPVRGSGLVVLHSPEGGDPYVLRWGTTR